jgi:hypothetical protein
MKGRLPTEGVLCPMGCGSTTDDPLDGPCSDCWSRIAGGVSSQPFPRVYRPRDPPETRSADGPEAAHRPTWP